MEINLSSEMIEKVTCVAFGRLNDLKARESIVKESIAVGKRQIARKKIILNDIEKAKEDAKEVHTLFLELLEQLENE